MKSFAIPANLRRQCTRNEVVVYCSDDVKVVGSGAGNTLGIHSMSSVLILLNLRAQPRSNWALGVAAFDAANLLVRLHTCWPHHQVVAPAKTAFNQ